MTFEREGLTINIINESVTARHAREKSGGKNRAEEWSRGVGSI